MQPILSIEEFQRFQEQLLDLRQSICDAKEGRIKAENKAKELELQLAELRSEHDQLQKLGGRKRRDSASECQQLRTKLLNTESEFVLQMSTLKTECHRLNVELEEMRENQLTKSRNLCPVECQTDPSLLLPTTTVSCQTDEEELNQLDVVKSELINLQSQHSICGPFVQTAGQRLNALEASFADAYAKCRERIGELVQDNGRLASQVDQLQSSLSRSETSETDFQSRLELVQRRNDKINRELKRQLKRLMVSQQQQVASPITNLASTYSGSQSSLVSCDTNRRRNSCSLGDEDKRSITSSSASDMGLSTMNNGSISNDHVTASDFKQLIDRIVLVQDENYTLRQQIKRLDAELVAKSEALQTELNNRLAPTPSPKPNPPSSSFASWWSSTTNKTAAGSSSKLSSVNVDTVNQLKQMCEQLITRNVQLTSELETERHKSSSINGNGSIVS